MKIENGLEFTFNGIAGYKVISCLSEDFTVTCESPHINPDGNHPQFRIGINAFQEMMNELEKK